MNLIDFQELIDKQIVNQIQNNFIKNYSFLITKDILDQSPTTIETIIVPAHEYRFEQISPDESKYEWEYWRRFEVSWYYKIGKLKRPLANKNAFLKFDFGGVG
ncbi:MAG TPA: hypothetical protein DF409_14065 [Bacteroidales bacterium]|nr:hypothetical protein [Bacteroidales bacterium]